MKAQNAGEERNLGRGEKVRRKSSWKKRDGKREKRKRERDQGVTVHCDYTIKGGEDREDNKDLHSCLLIKGLERAREGYKKNTKEREKERERGNTLFNYEHYSLTYT